MTTGNFKDQDLARLQERVSLLEFEASRRDVIDRVRTVILELSDDDYEAVLEGVSEALTQLGVPYRACSVHLVAAGDQSLTQWVRGHTGWVRSALTDDVQIIRRFQRESAPVYRPDLTQDDPFGEAGWALGRTPPVRCIVDAPWSHGTLSINSGEPNAFQPQDIETLAMLAEVLSEAFVRVEDLRSLKKSNQQLLDLHEISRLTTSSLDREQVLDTVGGQVVRRGVFRSLMIALVDRQAHRVKVMRSFIREEDHITETNEFGISYDLDDRDILAETVRTGETQIGVEWDERFTPPAHDPNFKPESRRGKVAYFIPVKAHDEVVAVVATGSTVEDQEETTQRLAELQPLWDQLAIALSNAALYEAAQKEIAERKRAEQELRAGSTITAQIRA